MNIVDSCLIIKNEEANIRELIEQLLVFSHEVHITDTGSTDNTLNIINELQRNHPNLILHYYEWDMNFSNAKNYSLHYDNNVSNYQFWCDGDDLLNEALMNSLVNFVNSDESDDIYYIKYQYYDGDLNPHFRTSILKTEQNLSWIDPIHEFVGLKPGLKLNHLYFDNGSLIIHHQKEVHASRNLEIFQNMERTNWNFTSRNYFYYGRELESVGLTKSAYEMYKKCIYHEHVNDYTDTFNALNGMKRIKFNEDWLKAFYYLLENNQYRGDIFYNAGNYYFEKGCKELAKFFYLAAINYKYNPHCSFGLDMYDITVNPLLQLGLIVYQENDIEGSLRYNERVLEYDENNTTAKNNILFLNNRLNQQNEKV